MEISKRKLAPVSLFDATRTVYLACQAKGNHDLCRASIVFGLELPHYCLQCAHNRDAYGVTDPNYELKDFLAGHMPRSLMPDLNRLILKELFSFIDQTPDINMSRARELLDRGKGMLKELDPWFYEEEYIDRLIDEDREDWDAAQAYAASAAAEKAAIEGPDMGW